MLQLEVRDSEEQQARSQKTACARRCWVFKQYEDSEKRNHRSEASEDGRANPEQEHHKERVSLDKLEKI